MVRNKEIVLDSRKSPPDFSTFISLMTFFVSISWMWVENNTAAYRNRLPGRAWPFPGHARDIRQPLKCKRSSLSHDFLATSVNGRHCCA
jgi:hypothetical protein